MNTDDIYRFRSFGPAPPNARAVARELAKALRQTPAPSPAQPKISAEKKPKVVKPPSDRDVKIYSAIKKGRKGRLYAVDVGHTGVKTPKSWREKGCPYTYPKAYDAGKPWTTKMSKEKANIKKRVEDFQKSLNSL